MINEVILIGRLTKDILASKATDGTLIARFTLAVNRDKEKADFISCVGFGKTAELLETYCSKGQQIAIVGSLRTRTYEKDGKTVYTTEVYTKQIQFLSKNDSKQEESEQKQQYILDISSDDLPF